MKKHCLFTGQEFKTSDINDILSPDTRAAILKVFTLDKKLKESIVTAILTDENTIVEIARTMFSVRAKEVGLNSPGSIADLFRKPPRKKDKKKDR